MLDRNEGGRQQATIRDVARLAGVSIKTVSRVINEKPHVSEPTRLRVQSAVDKLNFQPNALARQLGSMRKKSVLPKARAVTEVSVPAAESANREIDWW